MNRNFKNVFLGEGYNNKKTKLSGNDKEIEMD